MRKAEEFLDFINEKEFTIPVTVNMPNNNTLRITGRDDNVTVIITKKQLQALTDIRVIHTNATFTIS